MGKGAADSDMSLRLEGPTGLRRLGHGPVRQPRGPDVSLAEQLQAGGEGMQTARAHGLELRRGTTVIRAASPPAARAA